MVQRWGLLPNFDRQIQLLSLHNVKLSDTFLSISQALVSREGSMRYSLSCSRAEPADVDEVSKGQMYYLIFLVAGTSAISAAVFYLVPITGNLVSLETLRIPYPHVIIGAACSLLIAAATIFYLRGGGKREGGEVAPPVSLS